MKEHPVGRLLIDDKEAQNLFRAITLRQHDLRKKCQPTMKEEKVMSKTEHGLVYPDVKKVPAFGHGGYATGCERAMWEFLEYLRSKGIDFEEYT